MPGDVGRSASTIAGTIHSILSSRALTLAELGRRARVAFPGDKRFHIPLNLYHVLGRQFRPSLHQIFALSRLSDYRMADWLAVFGLMLADIPRLQAVLPSRRTTLIDTTLLDESEPFLRFEYSASGVFPTSIRPLGEWVRLRSQHRGSTPEFSSQPFLFAKIGSHDAFAYPDLLPGSILRVIRLGRTPFQAMPIGQNGAFFLIEHAKGLTCTRLHAVTHNRVVLYPTVLPFAQVELELGKEARILGIAEFELRPAACSPTVRVPRSLHRFWSPDRLPRSPAALPLEKLLAAARRRAGLTFRETSAKSSLIARLLKHPDYFCAAGTLSDYESKTGVPRHAEKMLSLCVLYSLSPWDFMASAGLTVSESGREPLPEDLLRDVSQRSSASSGEPSDSGGRTLGEVPYAFGRIGSEIFKMNHLSIRDLFWAGNPNQHRHPYLADAILLIVDRRKKQIRTLLQAPLWAQPLYVFLRRDGQFVCGSSIAESGTLVLRPFSNGLDRPLRFKNPSEIESVGRVVGILRKLFAAGNQS